MLRQQMLDRRSPSRRVAGRNENLGLELRGSCQCPGSSCTSGYLEARETRRVFSIRNTSGKNDGRKFEAALGF